MHNFIWLMVTLKPRPLFDKEKMQIKQNYIRREMLRCLSDDAVLDTLFMSFASGSIGHGKTSLKLS